MEHHLCKLTLVFPPSGADHIVELLLHSSPPVTGFTMWKGDGHGEGFATASVGERVRGSVNRLILVVVLDVGRARLLVEELKAKAPLQHLAYWIEPVLEFGRVAVERAGHAEPPSHAQCQENVSRGQA